MPISDTEFEMACRAAFQRLVHVFGFDEPEAVRIGRELYVRYHRADQTVSISWEEGLSPIIEVFYPVSGTSERSIQWAEKNGIARARRIPRLATGVKFTSGSLTAYLTAQNQALEAEEAAFLGTHA